MTKASLFTILFLALAGVMGLQSQIPTPTYMPAHSETPLVIAAPNGGTTYTLPITVTHPAESRYYVNGLKRVYGVYYTISGNTLTILSGNPPSGSDGDSHELSAY
jgi:hypothetical protein